MASIFTFKSHLKSHSLLSMFKLSLFKNVHCWKPSWDVNRFVLCRSGAYCIIHSYRNFFSFFFLSFFDHFLCPMFRNREKKRTCIQETITNHFWWLWNRYQCVKNVSIISLPCIRMFKYQFCCYVSLCCFFCFQADVIGLTSEKGTFEQSTLLIAKKK